MSLLDPAAIPGYPEAIAKEQANRDFAMMDSVPICGLPCRQISLRAWILLKRASNAFIVGGRVPTKEEVAIFLWLLSPEYRIDEKAHFRFAKKRVYPLVQKKGLAWCILEIKAHLEAAFQDSPGGGGASGGPEYVNSAAAIIDSVASEYGWSAAAIMDMPLAQIFLYQRAGKMRRNPKAVMFNESEKYLRDYMRKRQMEADEVAARQN